MSDQPNARVFKVGACMKKSGPGGYAAIPKYEEPAFRVPLSPRLHDGIFLKPTGIVHPKLALAPIML